ncbi:MAG: hypothetical protein EXR71_05740 [Myxococcales bacterium]|nr:hypothetical protein [Myxococcales bacterium]
MTLFFALALAGEPTTLFVDPTDLRILRLPGVEAMGTPGGDHSPAVGAGLFLTLAGARVDLAGVDELRAPIPADSARTFAGLVSSAAPLIATLVISPADFAATVGDEPALRCHRARIEEIALTLSATGTEMRGRRVIVGTESTTPGRCPVVSSPG